MKKKNNDKSAQNESLDNRPSSASRRDLLKSAGLVGAAAVSTVAGSNVIAADSPGSRTDPAADSPGAADRHAEPGFDAAGLAVHNPPGNNGTIRFLVNRRLCELLPGEAHQFPAAEEWVIQFHPGGEFENVERTITRGVYHFIVR